MYELFALFLAGVIAMMGIGGLELTLSYQRGNVARQATHVAQDYLVQAERDYLSTVAAQVSSPSYDPTNNPVSVNSYTSTESKICPAAGTAPAQGQSTGRTTVINGAGGDSTCKYYATYTITPANTTTATATGTACGTATSGTNELSCNVNVNAGEQRLSAIITTSVRSAATGSAGSVLLSTKKRTLTIRTFALAPYVAVVNSSDTQDPFLAANGTIGSSGGASEGDVAGVDPAGADSTKIASFSSCEYDKNGGSAASVNQMGMMQQWCAGQDQTTLAAQQAQGNYNAAASAATGTWSAVNTSSYQNQTYTTSSGSANTGN